MIEFETIPSSIRKPGVYSEFDTKSAVRSLPNNKQKLLIIGQRIGALIEPEIFQGGTLDDMTSGGTYTGSLVKQFRVKVSSAGATDEFDWSSDNGENWTTGVAMTGGAQALEDGVTVTYGATTGHAVNDEWRFNAYPEPSVVEKVATQIYSDVEAASYFGYGSMAHLMVRAAIKANPYLDLTAVTLDDAGAGVAASGTVTITGPATTSGVITLYVANEKVEIAVSKDDTANAIAAALCNAIAAKPELPVTATNATGVITLTAKNKGLCGNDIGLGYGLTNASGVGVAIVAMATGATNPTLQDALDVVAGVQYHLIATPYNNQTDLATLRTHLDFVSDGINKKPATAFYGMNGALASATTLAGQVNSGRICNPYVRYTSATKRKSMPCEIAAAMASVKANVEDPALPLNYMEVPGIAVPDVADRLTFTEINSTCMYNGVAALDVGPGEKVQVVRAISTYIKDSQGVDDPSLLDMTTIWSLDYSRKAWVDRIALRFPNVKKTSRVKKEIRTQILDVAYRLEELEVLEDIDGNKDGIIVEDDGTDANRVNIEVPADVVNGLHVVAMKIDLIL